MVTYVKSFSNRSFGGNFFSRSFSGGFLSGSGFFSRSFGSGFFGGSFNSGVSRSGFVSGLISRFATNEQNSAQKNGKKSQLFHCVFPPNMEINF